MGKCYFNETWERKFPWVTSVKGNIHRAWCKFCLAEFGCEKGERELTRHSQGKKHQEFVHKRSTSDKTGQEKKSQSTIESAIKRSQEVVKEQNTLKNAVVKAETMLTQSVANHNLPTSYLNCLAELVPLIFPDSNIAKNMKLHQDKGIYLLEHGVALNLKNNLLQQMRLHPFSLNYDESTKGKRSQLNVNVSHRNKHNRIQKSNLTTIDVDVKLSGENICKKVFTELDEGSVPKTNLVSDKTDGCVVMLGKFAGCHAYAKREVETLPDLGGCGCHNACNCIKVSFLVFPYNSVTL